jgi:hypothetical protein
MGREAECVARWRGQAAEVKALLESAEIILRGGIKAKIPRSNISGVAVSGDDLTLDAGDDQLVLELGAAEAGKWMAALLKPPPGLKDKLGLKPGDTAFVIGAIDDETLATALQGAQAKAAKAASMLLAMLRSEDDLKTAFKIASAAPALPLWCIYQKGKSAPIGDAAIRTFLRANAYIDSKTASISPTLTATRYGARR